MWVIWEMKKSDTGQGVCPLVVSIYRSKIDRKVNEINSPSDCISKHRSISLIEQWRRY